MNTGSLSLYIAVLTALGTPAAAQPASMQAPVSGYVLDSRTRAIRPILGLPGSAVFGEPLDLPSPVASAAFPASGEFALASAADESGGLLLVRGLRGGAMVVAPIEEAIPAIDLMAFSADGSTAVLLSRRSRRLQFLGGLPAHPSLQASISLESLAGEITSLAVSGNGAQAALTSRDGDSAAITLVDQLPGATLRTAASLRDASAAVYANQDRDLIYLDAAAQAIVVLRGLEGARKPQVLLSAEGGSPAPSAICLSGSTLWVAGVRSQDSVSSGHLVAFDLDRGQVVSEQSLAALPSRLQALGRPGMFALNALEDGPLYLFSSADSSVVFVPSIVR